MREALRFLQPLALAAILTREIARVLGREFLQSLLKDVLGQKREICLLPLVRGLIIHEIGAMKGK
jgi:hypothetical protein